MSPALGCSHLATWRADSPKALHVLSPDFKIGWLFRGGGGEGRWTKPSGLTFHVHSGSAASATPILFLHNGLASGFTARSPEFKFHSYSSLNWVHTKTFGSSVTTMEGSRDDFSKLVCVSPTIGVSTQRGHIMYQACVFRVTP